MAKSGRILILCPIGHSGPNAEDRRVDQGIKAHGIAPLLLSLLALATAPAAAGEGFDGACIKNIGGALLDEEMQLTQWSQAKADPAMHWLTNDENVQALREFVAHMKQAGKETIVYVGGYEGDKWLSVHNWVMSVPVFEESLGTFIRMGCSMGLDATHNLRALPHGAQAKQNAYRVQAMMSYINPEAVTYLETHPHESDDWVNGHNFGAIVHNLNTACWDYENALGTAEKPGWMKRDFKGEKIVFIEQPPKDSGLEWKTQADWLPRECAKYLKRGWSVAYNPIDSGVSPAMIRRAVGELVEDEVAA